MRPSFRSSTTKMGDRGPAEGYATRKCKLPAEHNTATLKLYYPATENE